MIPEWKKCTSCGHVSLPCTMGQYGYEIGLYYRCVICNYKTVHLVRLDDIESLEYLVKVARHMGFKNNPIPF